MYIIQQNYTYFAKIIKICNKVFLLKKVSYISNDHPETAPSEGFMSKSTWHTHCHTYARGNGDGDGGWGVWGGALFEGGLGQSATALRV